MWVLANQELIEELNNVVNEQWALLVCLADLSRWNGSPKYLQPFLSEAARNDVLQLRENQERISELLAEAIVWEEFA